MDRFDWFARLAVDFNRHPTKALIHYFAWTFGLVALVAGGSRLLFADAGTCWGEILQLQLSALDEAPRNRFQFCTIETFNRSLGRDVVLATIYLLGLGIFLATWWRASWDIELERGRNGGPILGLIGVVALIITAVANALTRSNISIVEGDYQLRLATVISTLAWVRWILTAVLVAGFIATLISWLIRAVAQVFRALFDHGDPASYEPPQVEWPPDNYAAPGFGVCLSGGGLRSAAFSVGALSALEETPVDEPREGSSAGLLGQADVLASVSGGGYAAAAWRIAVGTEPGEHTQQPILGNPNECPVTHKRQRFQLTSTPDRPTEQLFPRLLVRRKYLSSGRGGLLVTAAWMIVQLLWHFGLLLAVVGLVAWPMGRLIQSPIITSGIDPQTGEAIVQYSRLATPGLFVLAIVAVVIVLRSFTAEGRWRTVGNYAVLALSALSVGLLTVLVAMPWMVKELIPALADLLPGGRGAQSTVATILTGSVVATVWRVIQAPLKTYAAYLGGALLFVGLTLFGALVSFHASEGGRFFSMNWTWWVIALAIFTGIMSGLNPDLWSLHPIYRRRLASTFANRKAEDGWTGLTSKSEHLPLSAYGRAPGPKPLICAVAARMDRSNTGVPVVSMTFEPDYVTVHQGPDASSIAIRTDAYEKVFGGRLRARWLQSVLGLAAMSGAAVAPSLGRMSMGSTNALIAALNLRLGVWMPNPLYRRGRRAGTQMLNMFKEILGSFYLDDPNLYVTDGGHWENLGLVELIRRKTKIIIAVDASADPPYSFVTLLEAIELALLECDADVDFRGGEFEAMRPDGVARPPKNWCTAEIHYDDGSTGKLLFVKAQASEAMPLDVLRYSKEDPAFPNYSTANQFLSEAEFSNLAILGRESMINALEDHRAWLFSVEPQPEVVPDESVVESIPMEAGEYRAPIIAIDGVETAPVIKVKEPPKKRKSPTAPALAIPAGSGGGWGSAVQH